MTSFDSGHQDQVTDAQLDYYGRRLATCSSDKTIKVFSVAGDQQSHLADLRGHEGPVWQVCWAHPKFGSLLASCSFDHHIIIWKEVNGQWQQVYVSPKTLHTGSVNSIAWAPHDLGLILAAASSDGSVSVLEYNAAMGTWDTVKLPGTHAVGATAVSWAPSLPPGALLAGKAPATAPLKRLVSCGCDNMLRVWRCGEGGTWELEQALGGHTDWVRDCAWAPHLGMARSTIASAGQDGQVFAWNEQPAGGWDKKLVHDFKVPVWRVSWSVTGGLLAVSDASNAVTLWKESVDGLWAQVPH